MFDGARFTAYRWTDRKAQAVTSLLEHQGRLLVGTFAGGLLEFDGKQFRELKAEEKRINGIERVTVDKKIYLEQKSRHTARIVMKDVSETTK